MESQIEVKRETVVSWWNHNSSFQIGIVGGAISTNRGGDAIKINLVKVNTVTLKSVFSFHYTNHCKINVKN